MERRPNFLTQALLSPRNRIIFLAVLPCFFALNLAHSPAQTPITSSGLNTQVNLSATPPAGKVQYDITGGTRPGGGTNLFHSFGDFNVPNNNIANFLNDSGLATSNILGRVTGGNISNIFGTIQTTGFGNANLFLMNPAGFLFGPNATVNVGGMVAFTSADYLRLADGVRFNATPNATADALLTPSPVAAFGFLGSNPGAITVQGSQFTVTDGQSISFVGGNVTLQAGTPEGGTAQPARLSAPNGKIQLASAASPGEFDAATLQSLPNVENALFSSFGSVTLAPGSNINLSGVNTVSIRGGQFVLSVNDAILSTANSAGQQETISLSPSSSIISSNAGTEPGADVQIIAGNLQMDGVFIQSTTTGDGPGGHITINAGNVNLTNGSQIVSSSEGAGAGGNIGITAGNTLSIVGFDATGTVSGIIDPDSGLVRSGVYSTTSSSGTSGDIAVSTQLLTMEEGALLSSLTSGDGQGGRISVIDTGAVSLASGAQITSRTDGSGHGGEIVVNAMDSITMAGLSLDTFSISGIVSQTTASGNGGGISVSAPDVTLQDMGQIRSLTTSPLLGNAGNGGSITISAPNTLSIFGFSDDFGIGSGIFSSGEQGNSGAVSISGGTVNIGDRAIILTSQNLNGSSGNITLNVGNFDITSGAEVRTISGSFGSPSTGTIRITASDTVSLSGQFDTSTPSRISNESNSVLGSNGSIEIQARQFLMSDGANILSNTAAPQGGTVNISATDSIAMAGGAMMANERGSLEFGSFNLNAHSISLDQAVIRSRTFGDHDAGTITLNATGGNLALSNDSHILTSTQGGSGTAGPITVSASDSVLLSGGSTIESSSDNIATGNGGLVTVTAQNLVSLTGTGTGLFSLTTTQGNGGIINVQANQVQLSDGAVISAKSTGSGNAGTVTVQGLVSPAQTVLIDGPASGIFTDTQGTGAGGDISINAHSVTLQNGGTLSAATSSTVLSATGGTITVAANQVQMDTGALITAQTTNAGNAGTINILADTLTLGNGSILNTSTAPGSTGRGGDIDIQVRQASLSGFSAITSETAGQGDAGAISIRGSDSISLVNSFVVSNAATFPLSTAQGGPITLHAPNIEVRGSLISSSTDGPGNAGNIHIETQGLTVTGAGDFSDFSAISARTEGPGQAGQITIRGIDGAGSHADDVILSGNSQIVSETVSSVRAVGGNAGGVTIDTARLSLGEFSGISTASSGTAPSGLSPGRAGNITINAADSVTVSGGLITTSTGTSGNAGDITVNTGTLNLTAGGQLATSSFASGSAGNVTVEGVQGPGSTANSVVIDGPGSGISTETHGTGAGGDISLSAQSVTLQNGGMLSASTSGTTSSATGGNITIDGSDVRLTTGAMITAESLGPGQGGTVSISANQRIMATDSFILTSTVPDIGDGGAGGDIVLNAPNLSLERSGLFASTSGTGNAGNVALQGQQITLASDTVVATSTDGQGAAGTIRVEGLQGPGSRVTSMSLSNSRIESETIGNLGSEGPAGSIFVETARLTLTDSQLSSRSSFSPGNAGQLVVNASDQIQMVRSNVTSSSEGVVTDPVTGDPVQTGNAGQIVMQAPHIILADASQVTTSTEFTGQAGNIMLNTANLEVRSGSKITSSSVTGPSDETPTGAAGNVTVQDLANPAQTVLIDGPGSGIFTETQGTGAGGNIDIAAQAFTLQNGGALSAKTIGAGNAGNILVKADTVSIESGAQLTSSSVQRAPLFEGEDVPLPSGNAGNVTLQGLDGPGSRATSVLIDGTGSGLSTDTDGTGFGGNIVVKANTVTLQNSGTLSAATSGAAPTATGGTITVNANQVQLTSGGLITAASTGAGTGGLITIDANSTFASNAGTVSSTATQATGGDIHITAGQSVTLDNGSSITASSTGAGNAGNIVINAGENFFSTSSSVTTNAKAPGTQALGGNITLNAANTVLLTNSEINASVQGASETIGGNITIDPQYVILLNSQILTRATEGQGGNIFITTNFLLPDANSIISASSQFGTNGTITIQSPISPASGKINPLSQKPLVATSLLSQRCAALASGELSSLTVAGRDSLPAEPGSWLSSPLALAGQYRGTALTEGGTRTSLNNSDGDMPLLSLRQIAPPGFLTRAFALDGSAGCES